ncbi:MAG: (d)CMP kinase [gamma proteobacterium symbiont of Bathyaustriella thionipta]|nr:(d)CMP kinase [gamma proteobacterium symbiont of Bathyaustriella thionipta]
MNATIPVITIDGPSGSGKGTIAKQLAEQLGWHLLDSGALYRVLACYAQRQQVQADEAAKLGELARLLPIRFEGERIWLDSEDVSSLIRTESMGNAASRIAAIPEVRAGLLQRQRDFVRPPGLVADGRDMGTVVFPQAQVKIFLTASAEERAKRRYKQLLDKGMTVKMNSLVEEIRERDERDRTRTESPLEVPAAALQLDSSSMSIETVMQQVLDFVQLKLSPAAS